MNNAKYRRRLRQTALLRDAARFGIWLAIALALVIVIRNLPCLS